MDQNQNQNQNQIDLNNPGEDNKNWRDTYHHYFDFVNHEDQKFTVKRWYGGLDVGNGVNYNTYHLFDKDDKKIDRDFELRYSKDKGEFKKTYKLLRVHSLDLMYHFLDQRMNKSKYKTEDDDIFCIEPSEQNLQKLKYLGFCEYLHEFDPYNKKKNVLFITKAEFNKRKDEILEKINKLNKNQVTNDEMDKEINSDKFKDIKEFHDKLAPPAERKKSR